LSLFPGEEEETDVDGGVEEETIFASLCRHVEKLTELILPAPAR
jgi:hypothetical protein